MKTWILSAGLILVAVAAWADLRVAATVPNMGMLAREIGGDAVTVTVMAPPDRDAHYLEARPSMMAALRRADIVVAVGAELEIGWLPAAIQGANNRRIQPGQPGYFEAARKVNLLWDDKPADRALGDVHPAGNPHIYMDPGRMADVGKAMAERFASLSPNQAQEFRANAERIAARIEEQTPVWRERAEGAPGVMAYHTDTDYLLAFLHVPILGHMEALPGVPPTASHLRKLVREFQDTEGVLWSMNFHPDGAGEFLSRELGWPSYRLPGQVGMEADLEEFIEMIDDWVNTLE